VSDQLLLVGSIPFDTPKEVFETFGTPLGRFLGAVPDGEVGPRSHWISRIHYQVFAGHPELEILARPRPDNGVERLNPHDNSDRWQFKVRDGVAQVRFGDPGWRLGFARDAINSYFVFQTLKDKGVLAPHLRFQVSLPMVNSAVPPRVFPVAGDLDKIKPGFEAALRAELAKIIEKIPAKDLAIQWDCAPKSRTPTPPSRNYRPRARSSETWRRCAVCLTGSRKRSRWVITCASARWEAGRAFNRRR
jgi:hypothetical protein